MSHQTGKHGRDLDLRQFTSDHVIAAHMERLFGQSTRPQPTGEQSPADSQTWPYSSRYFTPESINGQHALQLLQDDAEYFELGDVLLATNTTDTDGVVSQEWEHCTAIYPTPMRTTLSDVDDGRTRVCFVSVRRRWTPKRTYCQYHLAKSRWLDMLNELEITPDAIELLHEDSGAFSSHTTICQEGKCQKANGQSLCAYHVILKLQSFINEHHFVYARHDFHTGKEVFLVAGTHLEEQARCLKDLFATTTTKHRIFPTLLALFGYWEGRVSKLRWQLDVAVQEVESNTGHAVSHKQRNYTLPPDKLASRRVDMVGTRFASTHVHRVSEQLRDIAVFLSEEVMSYHQCLQDLEQSKNQPRVPWSGGHMRSSFLQRKSRAEGHLRQSGALMWRIDIQWKVADALIAQHNHTLNHAIAQDSRADSVFIRRISFVTLAFLPATFLATFFSMTFFRLEKAKLTVSPQIWIYVVCAMPITLFVAWQFGSQGIVKRRLERIRLMLQSRSTHIKSRRVGSG